MITKQNLTGWFKKVFQRAPRTDKTQEEAPGLRIDGISPAPLTPEPDDSELAAHALLETLSSKERKTKAGKAATGQHEPEKGTAEHYRRLAAKIRLAHDDARLRATRFVAYCEQELEKPRLPMTGPGSLILLETELYKRVDTVEREGGELQKRWKRCLGEVTLRLMEAQKGLSQD